MTQDAGQAVGTLPTQLRQAVTLTPATAAALDALDVVERVGTVNLNMPEMAWLWFVLRVTPDNAKTFPHGKWATIQAIEGQIEDAAINQLRGASDSERAPK